MGLAPVFAFIFWCGQCGPSGLTWNVLYANFNKALTVDDTAFSLQLHLGAAVVEGIVSDRY